MHINISLPIIPCMTVYVTNNKEPWTLNLEHFLFIVIYSSDIDICTVFFS